MRGSRWPHWNGPGREIAQERFPAARVDLRLAQALDAPRAQVDQVRALLHQHEADNGGIAELLARAAAAREAGRLDQDDASALPLYQRVLVLQPRNQHAVEGREDALTDLLQPAQAALERGDAETVAELVKRAQPLRSRPCRTARLAGGPGPTA